LREIKERWAELPVMMVTAYGDDERRRRAGEHGAAEFITKPVDFEMLKERLRQHAQCIRLTDRNGRSQPDSAGPGRRRGGRLRGMKSGSRPAG
jgi:DNA-binding response OmpR family regulator